MAGNRWGTNAQHGVTPVLLLGVEETLQQIDTIIENALDFSDVWPVLGAKWVKHEQAAFAEGQNKWLPLRPETLRKKRPMTKKLEDIGYMKFGLEDLRPRFSARMFAAYGPQKYDRRTMNPAILHATGSRDKTLPQRVPVPKLSRAEKAKWISTVKDHMAKVIRDSQG